MYQEDYIEFPRKITHEEFEFKIELMIIETIEFDSMHVNAMSHRNADDDKQRTHKSQLNSLGKALKCNVIQLATMIDDRLDWQTGTFQLL